MRTSHGTPTHRSVNVHAAVGHDLGTGPDGRGHYQIAVASIHALPRTDRLVVHQGRGRDILHHRCGLHDGNRRAWDAEVRNDRQIDFARQFLDPRAALNQPDGDHSRAPDGIDDGSQFRQFRLVRQMRKVEADRGPLEELGCRRGAARELVEDGAGVGRTDTHLHQPHLTKSDFDRLFALA